ncbi:MORN motif protein (macronuclear) [Tetrahymena thermophila SB210]|uniref:MORN motif protein n=1 Tax=Tetrahymena thermophila (strain SB210) TaxID=312017 RepID=Q23JN0_TETTS|nr:MORN motif protein [Tetrahymena thermophila SB210]EAR96713.3 MORN motif protein [Tetrahymena thermophila SB210]|eukprot:XP_001016958.3 MORN motif protein [Tetrahymena thermophila SB210]
MKVTNTAPNQIIQYRSCSSNRSPIYIQYPKTYVKTIQIPKYTTNLVHISTKQIPIINVKKEQKIVLPTQYHSTPICKVQNSSQKKQETTINQDCLETLQTSKEINEKNEQSIESINFIKGINNQSYEQENSLVTQNLSQNISLMYQNPVRQNSQKVLFPLTPNMNNNSFFLDNRVNKHQTTSQNTSYISTTTRIRSLSPVILTPKVQRVQKIPVITKMYSSQINLHPVSTSIINTIPIQKINLISPQNIITTNTIIHRKYQDGSIYEGQLQNNQKQGKGKLIFTDGSYYIGEFLNDQINGLGEYYSRDNKLIYEGEWSSNKYHGRGIYHNILNKQSHNQEKLAVDYNDFANYESLWTEYEGQFFEGQKNGTGLIQFIDGSQYFGGFKHDEIDGAGVYTLNNETKQQVTGSWSQNKLEILLN